MLSRYGVAHGAASRTSQQPCEAPCRWPGSTGVYQCCCFAKRIPRVRSPVVAFAAGDLLYMMTSNCVQIPVALQGGRILGAEQGGVLAAGSKCATGGRIERARRLAFQEFRRARSSAAACVSGRSRQKCTRIGVQRSLPQVHTVRTLDDTAEIHDQHTIGHMPHNRQVV